MRSANDWEEEGVLLLKAHLLGNVKVTYEGDDETLWLNNSSGQFNIKTKGQLHQSMLFVWAASKESFQQRTCLQGETSSWLVVIPCVLGRES